MRRRRLVLGALAGLAAGAFVLGAALGDSPAPRVEVAATLPLPQLAGERIVAGLDGTGIPAAAADRGSPGRVAGVILFAGNFPSRAAGRRLVAELQGIRRPAALRDPLLIMVDQEGGLVKRVGGAPSASAQQMGARGAAFSREQGRRTAANLRDLGVNVDLAPVLDVARPGGTIAETERGFGSTASGHRHRDPLCRRSPAGRRGGHRQALPGTGGGRREHRLRGAADRPLEADPARRRRGALPRLRRHRRRHGDAQHRDLPRLPGRPAAFARSIATGELRSRLGFQGVSITDALEAASVRAFGGPAKAGLAAVAAGTDLLLFTDPMRRQGAAGPGRRRVRRPRSSRRRIAAGAGAAPASRAARRGAGPRWRSGRRREARFDDREAMLRSKRAVGIRHLAHACARASAS